MGRKDYCPGRRSHLRVGHKDLQQLRKALEEATSRNKATYHHQRRAADCSCHAARKEGNCSAMRRHFRDA